MISDPDYARRRNLLYRLWDNAVEAAEYEKSEWIELEKELLHTDYTTRPDARSNGE